ncbi:hypothetical protein [Aquimarina litoralis]|uniref:hypothetical protein n=1 Tax=Aquimarina litoralis TaxID=584605 RepID=UPI001C590FBF|nr:hypothetical protein [Aquimarina litoralis]
MIKKFPFLVMIALATLSCESSSVEDEVFNAENEIEVSENEDIEIIDIHNDNRHGLGN